MTIEYDEKELQRLKNGACLVIGGIGLFLGVFGVKYAYDKYRNIEKMIGDAASHVSKLTSVDVQDTIIKKAVTDSANRQIDKAVSEAVGVIKNDISIQSRSLIKEAVGKRYGEIESVVTNAVNQAVTKNVDVKSLYNETIKEAKKDMVEKLVEKMTDMLDENDDESMIRILLKAIK